MRVRLYAIRTVTDVRLYEIPEGTADEDIPALVDSEYYDKQPSAGVRLIEVEPTTEDPCERVIYRVRPDGKDEEKPMFEKVS